MRTIARGCAAAGAALALAVLPAGAAGAAEGDFSGVPPYRTEGTPVEGTANSAEAPELAPGLSTDVIGPGERKYYSVALDGVSDVYLSAFGLPGAGRSVAYDDGLDLRLLGVDGTRCADEDPTFGTDGAARPVGDYVVRAIDPGGQCQRADTYLLLVERAKSSGTGAASDPREWPLELSYMVEPPLKKGEQPPVPTPGASEPPAAAVGERKPVEGGTGFNDAPAVGAGVWQDRLLPGRTAFYRVPVEWGQQVFADAQFANAERITDENGYTSSGVRLELFNTARGLVTSESGLYQGEQAAVAIGTAPAAYANRSNNAVSGEAADMRFTGWYYLAVSLHPDTARFIDGGVAVNLRIRLAGKPGEPLEYAGDAVGAGFGITDDDRSAAADGALPGTGEGGSGAKPLLAAAGLGTGTVLLLGLLLWTVAARRRAAVTTAAR